MYWKVDEELIFANDAIYTYLNFLSNAPRLKILAIKDFLLQCHFYLFV